MTTATPSVRHCYATGSANNRLHYLDFGGTGRPLVLMHGVTGHAWNWYQVAAGLTDHNRVYALDFRGFGESSWAGGGAYSTGDHVADLAVLVVSLGADDIDLMGSSWGALVAIQYASERPGEVRRLVVVDVEASFDQAETDLLPRSAHFERQLDVVVAEAERNPNASSEMVATMAATGYSPGPDGKLVPKHDPFFFERWPFRSDDHWDRLGGIAADTLLVHASNSFVRSDVMAEMAAQIPQAAMVELANSGHTAPVENPVGLVEIVGPFLAPESY